jgi:hypothetical protein
MGGGAFGKRQRQPSRIRHDRESDSIATEPIPGHFKLQRIAHGLIQSPCSHFYRMSKFVTVDVIGKKRDKKELSTEEIKFVVDGFTSGAIADYQMSALLMAIVVLFVC